MLNDNNAFIYLHDKVLLIGTCSGPGACVVSDWEQPVYKANFSEISDSEIGQEVRNAWSRCREISNSATNDLLEKARSAHLEFMGAKNNRKLYRNTKCVHPLLIFKDGLIYIGATHQKSIGGFVGLDEHVKLPKTVSNEELGKVVREMLELSRTNY